MSYGKIPSKGLGAHDGEMQRLFRHAMGETIDAVHFGVDDQGLDAKFFGATSGKYALWDESADTFYFPCTMDIDGTVTVGVDDTGYDVKFFGATSGCYQEWDESADQANIVTTSAATTGTLRSLNISHTMTAASTGNEVEALYVRMTADVKTGAWANAIVGSIDYSTSGAAHGMAAAICAEMIPPDSSLARGALYALDLEFGCGDSSSWASAGPVAFMKMENWGTAAHFSANAFLFHLAGETAASGALVSADTQTLKCRIGTTTRYLAMSQQENVLHLGNYSTANDCDTAQDPHAASGSTIPFYVNVTSSITDGNVYGAWIHLKQTANTTGSPRTLTLWCVVSHPTTTTCAGANALHAQTYVDTGCTGVTGGVHAAASHLIVAQESRIIQGTYCAHLFVNEFEDDNTMPASTYFLRFDDAGVKKTPYFFDVSNATAGTDNMYSTDPADVQNGKVAATLKVRVLGVDYWIPLWDVKTGA